ncbi:glycine/betaine ABC transporter, partial [Mesorhizobium sp. M1A.F.Ca.IN.020.32.1.1]
MKILWKALCAAAMVGLTMMPARAEEKTIEMGTLSWEDLTPITG